jgi:hypothetical protein
MKDKDENAAWIICNITGHDLGYLYYEVPQICPCGKTVIVHQEIWVEETDG